jgi:acyl carrier protein
MDFLKLFELVAKISRPASSKSIEILNLEEKLQDVGIDSLDAMIIGMYLCDLYGIPEDDETKSWNPETVKQFYDYLMRRKTKEPSSLEEAREQMK